VRRGNQIRSDVKQEVNFQAEHYLSITRLIKKKSKQVDWPGAGRGYKRPRVARSNETKKDKEERKIACIELIVEIKIINIYYYHCQA
jgi:hypothetical protein